MATLEKAVGYRGDHMNLPVADVTAAVSFYQRSLGFTLVSTSDVPHKTAVLARDRVEIRLVENGGDPSQDGCAFHVRDVDGLFGQFSRSEMGEALGAVKSEQHEGVTWRVFYVVAPDGLCYWFGERQDRQDASAR